MKKLNLGCGEAPLKGFINVDLYSNKSEVKHDLNVFPYPFQNSEVDYVLMSDVLEHLDDPRSVIKEIKRILKVGGRLKLIVPHFSYFGAHSPFHKSFWSYNAICYPKNGNDSQLIELWDGFKQIEKKLVFTNIPPKSIISKLFVFIETWPKIMLAPLFNKYPVKYERSWIKNFIPCYKIEAILEKE